MSTSSSLEKCVFYIPPINQSYLRFIPQILHDSNSFRRFLKYSNHDSLVILSDVNLLDKFKEYPIKCKLVDDYSGTILESDYFNKWIISRTKVFKLFLKKKFKNALSSHRINLLEIMKGANIIRSILVDSLSKSLTIKNIIEQENPDKFLLFDSTSAHNKIVSEMAKDSGIEVFTILPRKISIFLSNFNNFIMNFAFSFKNYFKWVKTFKFLPKEDVKKTVLISTDYFQTVEQFVPIIKEINSSDDLYCYVVSDNKLTKSKLKQNNIDFQIPFSLVTYSSYNRISKKSYSIRNKWSEFKNSNSFNNLCQFNGVNIKPLIVQHFDRFFSRNTVYGSLFKILVQIEVLNYLYIKKKLDLILLGNDTSLNEQISINFTSLNKIMNLEIQHGLIHPYSRALKVVRSKSPEEVMKINSDKIAVWGSGFKSFLMEAGNQDSSIEVTGNPRFDSFSFLSENFHKKDFISSNFNFDADCKVITLFVAPFIYKDNHPGWASRTKEIESLLKMIDKIICQDSSLSFVIKPHPRDDINFVKARVRELMKNKSRISVKNLDTYELLLLSDIVITQTSTVGLEAMVMEKPVICFSLNNDFSSQFPYVFNKAAIGISNHLELKNAIYSILGDDKFKAKLKLASSKFVEDFAYKNDGNSSKRVVELIKSMT